MIKRIQDTQYAEGAVAPSETDDGLHLLVNNGDLAALEETVERLGFKDGESLFRYALAVIAQAATRSLTITQVDGKLRTFNPMPALLTEPAAVAPTPHPAAP